MQSIHDVNHWYLAGPMSHIPQFNVPAFLTAAEELRASGLTIQLPADLDDPKVVKLLLTSPDGEHMPDGPTWGECLAADVKLIADVVGGVLVLPGWNNSRGARLETFTSRALCGKPVAYATSMRAVPKRSLASAWLADWAPELLGTTVTR